MARPRSDISERLVKAARKHFLARGVDGASLREIARDARTSVGMVTYYFPSKDDLFLAVLERVYPKILADLRAALESELPLEQRIARAYTRLHAIDDEEFAVIRIVLREVLVSSARLKKLVARFTEQGAHVPLLIAALGEGARTGRVREDLSPMVVIAATIALGMAPTILRRLAGGIGLGAELPPPEQLASEMSRILFEGIGKPAAQRTRRATPRARS